MKINNKHLLENDTTDTFNIITDLISGKDSGYFDFDIMDTIVIHFTAGSSATSSIKHLKQPTTKASAHLVVAKSGEITQLLPFDKIGWHAGESEHNGRKYLNKYSIGIEIDNPGRLTKRDGKFYTWFNTECNPDNVIYATHRNESSPSYWEKYTNEQLSVVKDICKLLIDKYNIKHIVGHEEIAPKRKTDPGPMFPLESFRTTLLPKTIKTDIIIDYTNSNKIAIVKPNKLNVRYGPGSEYAKIMEPLVKNTKVKILESVNGWSKIEIGIIGWVKSDYIDIQES